MDLSKAFDTVDFNILLDKLSFYGIKDVELLWFRNYLFNRTQTVEVNSVLSEPLISKCGVPQGSILGPLLFLIYVNDLSNVSKLVNFRLFADDTKIFYAHASIKRIQSTINEELPKLCKWFHANKLSMNLEKTNYVIFRGRCSISHENFNVHVVLNGCIVKNKSYVKYLGIIFHETMSWKKHIDYVKMKISQSSGAS